MPDRDPTLGNHLPTRIARRLAPWNRRMRFVDCASAMLLSLLPLSPSFALAARATQEPENVAAESTEADISSMVIVVGPGGEEKYERQFAEWAASWRELAERGGLTVIEIEAQADQAERLYQAIPQADASGSGARWLVLIGHGSYDGRQARFNLQGPDLDPIGLGARLAEVSGTWVVIQGAASSGPFLEALAAKDRVVITATRSGDEASAARWHRYLLEALADRQGVGDLDQDDQVSVFEAFVAASRAVAASYAAERRIATEHALLDDDGDGRGVTAEALTADQDADESRDGDLAKRIVLIPSSWERARSAEWLARRDSLEQELAAARRDHAGAEGNSATTKAALRKILERLSALYREAEN